MTRPVYKCDKVTMKILEEYPSATAAAQSEGVCARSFGERILKKRVGMKPYVFRYEDEYDPRERFGEHCQGRPVMRLDLRTKLVDVYYDAETAAEDTSITSAHVKAAIKSKRPVYRRYLFDWAR